MTRKCRNIIRVALVAVGIAAFAGASFAQQDTYAPVYPNGPLKAKRLKDPVSSLLELPFRLVKWPVDKSLVYIDNHHVADKAIYIYDRMKEYGFTPHLAFTDSAILPLMGGNADLVAVARQKEDYPDLIATASLRYAMDNRFVVDSEIGAQRIGETGFHSSGTFNFDHRSREPFYGIGPDTSLGDSSSVRMETTTLGYNVGYEFSPTLDLTGTFEFKENQLKHRAHKGKGDMTEIFAGRDIPGLYGGEELSWKAVLLRDTRDSHDEATRGSYQKLTFKFTEGVDSGKARFFTYQLDTAKYFRLGSPRRVLAVRFFGEHHDEVNGGEIPFYDMTRLGGMGSSQRTSETFRAFTYNRFYGESALLFNIEYRYAIWEYRDFRMNAAVFLDEGQTFNEFSAFKFSDFRESYGVGFYVSHSKHTVLNISVAHGDEGTKFYVKNKVAF